MPIEKILYSQQALQMFQSEIEVFDNIETGGVLIGYVDEDIIYVESASNGGPNAIHEEFYFRADPHYVDMFIDIEVANSCGKLRYLGEWHTHPQVEPEPSEIDLNSLCEIAESSFDFCVLLIVGSLGFDADNFERHSNSIIISKGEEASYISTQ